MDPTLSRVSPVLFLRENGWSPDDYPPLVGRFILATVFHDGESKTVFRSIAGSSWHCADISAKLRAERIIAAGKMAVQVCGGGTIGVNIPKGCVVIGGKSKVFGAVDYSVVQQLLQEALPDWPIEVNPDL